MIKKIEKKIEEIKLESQQLVQKRAQIAQENGLINTRLAELQGALNVLIPLVSEKKKETKEVKTETESK